MRLSAIISDYRIRMGISQREFSRRCGLSNSYISFLENEYNPKTGKPIVPTIEKYKMIAKGMDMIRLILYAILSNVSHTEEIANRRRKPWIMKSCATKF